VTLRARHPVLGEQTVAFELVGAEPEIA